MQSHRSLNNHRAWRRIKGNLALLWAKGKGEFDLRLEVDTEWSHWPKQNEDEQDTTAYMTVEIGETGDPARDNAIRDAVMGRDGLPAATDYAVEGVVYKLMPKFTRAPTGEPRRWQLRAFLTQARWPNG